MKTSELGNRRRRLNLVVVTVDGPTGSGKTTLGRRLALQLGLPFIDTGLFYRGLTVAVGNSGFNDSIGAAEAEHLARATNIDLNTDASAPVDAWTVKVNGVDVTHAARDVRNAKLLAYLSQIAEVRTALLDRQRDLAETGAVAVGRDCGTVVFPFAQVKFYLEAPAEVRARRRVTELSHRGGELGDDHLHAELVGRDLADSKREAAPLRVAEDAHVIDTGNLDIEAMVAQAMRICWAAGIVGEDTR